MTGGKIFENDVIYAGEIMTTINLQRKILEKGELLDLMTVYIKQIFEAAN